MLHSDGEARRVDEFLSWLRGSIQSLGDRGPVFIVSGSMGSTITTLRRNVGALTQPAGAEDDERRL
jgi:hypothetical protein